MVKSFYALYEFDKACDHVTGYVLRFCAQDCLERFLTGNEVEPADYVRGLDPDWCINSQEVCTYCGVPLFPAEFTDTVWLEQLKREKEQ